MNIIKNAGRFFLELIVVTIYIFLALFFLGSIEKQLGIVGDKNSNIVLLIAILIINLIFVYIIFTQLLSESLPFKYFNKKRLSKKSTRFLILISLILLLILSVYIKISN